MIIMVRLKSRERERERERVRARECISQDKKFGRTIRVL